MSVEHIHGVETVIPSHAPPANAFVMKAASAAISLLFLLSVPSHIQPNPTTLESDEEGRVDYND
jgi:hypothetical protein